VWGLLVDDIFNPGLPNAEPFPLPVHSGDVRPCIRAASELYCGIVDEVEAIGYDIFNKRAKTSTARRARVAGAAYIQAIAARIR
jgi:hypothetical protein